MIKLGGIISRNAFGLKEASEQYNHLDKQKLLRVINDKINKSHIATYDNGKITITIEKYDKVNFDVTIKEDY